MGDVEKEGETEAGIAMQTNKGNGDEQIDEGKVEEQEVNIFLTTKKLYSIIFYC